MMRNLTLLAILLMFLLSSKHIEADLRVGFYHDKCPSAEAIIRYEVSIAFSSNRGIAPGLVRLHFHNCFVRDQSLTNQAEKDGPPNGISSRGLEVIDNAKARLEASCKGTVSCADILAYAARDSIVLTGGLYWDVPAGRRDGRISNASETVDIADKGLSQDDMVALLGMSEVHAHTIGRSHCTSFANRLYSFNSTTSQDPKLNPVLAQFLKQQCPRNAQGAVSQTDVVFMNPTPNLMDSSYYGNLFQRNGLFTSDQTLLDSQKTTRQVAFYAAQGLAWQINFVQAMIKMSQIQVLTGTQGEIRVNCRVINP
ncbi:hypothetical protein RND81_12G144300 [Saponaria officinalis]|uniref:Peroxidase n=1 Tax=Saponaria officinalis TaxID=3572 RepID=A0AAW1HAM8_SAPOF